MRGRRTRQQRRCRPERRRKLVDNSVRAVKTSRQDHEAVFVDRCEIECETRWRRDRDWPSAAMIKLISTKTSRRESRNEQAEWTRASSCRSGLSRYNDCFPGAERLAERRQNGWWLGCIGTGWPSSSRQAHLFSLTGSHLKLAALHRMATRHAR